MNLVHQVSLDVGDVTLRARYTPVPESHKPLLIAIHGIGYDARYFDAEGMSVHERATAAGFSMLSITRPGYPATEESALTQPTFAESAHIVSSAIDEFWSGHDGGCPGVVLVGHSVGGAITIHIAAQMSMDTNRHIWPLLGIAISGIGNLPSPAAVARFGSAPRNIAMTLPYSLARAAFYGPPESLLAVSDDVFENLLVPSPSADAVEVNSTWQDDFPELARSIHVPVHVTLAQLDPLWEVNESKLDEMAGEFTHAPWVVSQIVPDTGHNIEHHRSGISYSDEVFDFAWRCAQSSDSLGDC